MNPTEPPYALAFLAAVIGGGLTCVLAWRVFRATSTSQAVDRVATAFWVLAASSLASIFAAAGWRGVVIAVPFLAAAGLAVLVCRRFGVKAE